MSYQDLPISKPPTTPPSTSVTGAHNHRVLNSGPYAWALVRWQLRPSWSWFLIVKIQYYESSNFVLLPLTLCCPLGLWTLHVNLFADVHTAEFLLRICLGEHSLPLLYYCRFYSLNSATRQNFSFLSNLSWSHLLSLICPLIWKHLIFSSLVITENFLCYFSWFTVPRLPSFPASGYFIMLGRRPPPP